MGIDFEKEYVLENQRVRLEPLTLDHVPKLIRFTEEVDIWTYFLGKSDGSSVFASYVQDSLTGRRKRDAYAFAGYVKRQEQFAGSTRFFDFQEDLNTVRMGYSWYGKNFWGTGLNKNCKFLLFQFAFDQMGVERIGLGAHSENTRSINAMKSIGCQPEGAIRNLFPAIQGKGRADAILLGILKEEWQKTVKNDLNQRL